MVKPKIGLSTLFCLSESFKKMTEHIIKAETTYIEIVDEGSHALDKRRVQILNELAASYGLKYTVHAPFADINIASPSKSLLNTMLKRLKKSILLSNDLNSQVWVFHPGLQTGVSMFYPGKAWVRNLKTVRLLFKFSNNHSVDAAIENVPEPFPFIMKNMKDFKRFYSEVDEDIGLVFDIGHANINKEIDSFLSAFPDKIVHIHAHDNDGKGDQHLGIGYGNVDWNNIRHLLRRTSYDRIVVVESVEHVEESMHKLRELLT